MKQHSFFIKGEYLLVALNETYNKGLLEVYAGPMNSGKSLRLIQRLDRLDYSNVTYKLFKPDVDKRDVAKLFSRLMTKSYLCNLISKEKPEEILNLYDGESVVAIDEIQFFDVNIWDTLEVLLNKKVNVLVAGLDTDFRGEPFGAMPYLLSQADLVYKLHAFCDYTNGGKKCGKPARMTQRLENGEPADYNSPIVLPGDVEEGYGARCREHHFVKNKPPKVIDMIL